MLVRLEPSGAGIPSKSSSDKLPDMRNMLVTLWDGFWPGNNSIGYIGWLCTYLVKCGGDIFLTWHFPFGWTRFGINENTCTMGITIERTRFHKVKAQMSNRIPFWLRYWQKDSRENHSGPVIVTFFFGGVGDSKTVSWHDAIKLRKSKSLSSTRMRRRCALVVRWWVTFHDQHGTLGLSWRVA